MLRIAERKVKPQSGDKLQSVQKSAFHFFGY